MDCSNYWSWYNDSDGELFMSIIGLVAGGGLIAIAIYMIASFILFECRRMNKTEKYLYVSVIINLVLLVLSLILSGIILIRS